MTRICPNPIVWNEVFQKLTEFAEGNRCTPAMPPKPLILNGWVFSNDLEKKQRWEETISWATANHCNDVVKNLADEHFYFVDEVTTYTIGPFGGPMYRPWNCDEKKCPSTEDIRAHLATLSSCWTELIGPTLSEFTRPISFTGEKARRLLVSAKDTVKPPWGDWFHLSSVESERRTFTRLRQKINEAISPHEIDHIDFVIEP